MGATNVAVRRGIAVAATAAILSFAGPAPAATPVERLGEAFRALETGAFAKAKRLAAQIPKNRLRNPDYADYVVAQASLLAGDARTARARFASLARQRGSRFAGVAAWRLADAEWALGRSDAARRSYQKLLRAERSTRNPDGDHALARFRIAEALARRGANDAAQAAFREVLRRDPAHPLATRASERMREIGGGRDQPLTPEDRLARAERLTDARLWREAVLELDRIGDEVPGEVRLRRDFQLGRTLFKMRRQYKLAGDTLLAIYDQLGRESDWALFHGARALSRQHFDEEAIVWYQRVVAEFPRSELAPEAQFLSGWLEFNMGHYERGIPHLEKVLARYARSKWAKPAVWYLGLSHFLRGDHAAALPYFERHGKQRDKLEGGQGRYWHARALELLGRREPANREYRELVGAWPFSWYSLLARARLRAQGIEIGPFGDGDTRDVRVTPVVAKPDPGLARDPLIRKVDELIAAGLDVHAAVELRRGERAFSRRHDRAQANAMLLDRYRAAGDYNRPWMLAAVRGRQALSIPPEGEARIWWQSAYPLAYRALVERHRELGGNPTYYLYAIMRKESGFNPHTVSYADALGLLQMIPPTTRRVVKALGMEYTDDLLFEPDNNIKLGSWYIGRLFQKFRGQIPIAASSYNAGPGATMRWLRTNGDRPIDEYQELVSYGQARGYGKKVTETYARYLYLYEGEVYDQPLTVDADYVRDEITY